MSQLKTTTPRRIKVWDLPTRLFHWLLVIGIFGMWFTADVLDQLSLHMAMGYALIGLIIFRLIWGLIGSDTARFTQFIRGPRAIIQYLKNPSETVHLGHNPLGALSVIALLLVLMIQLGTGLFANDQIYSEGPFSDFVSERTQDLLTYIHEINFYVLLGLIALHLMAIAVHQFKKHEPLVRAMVTGQRELKAGETVQNPTLRFAGVIAFGFALVLAVGAWYLVSQEPKLLAGWLGLH